MRNTVSIIFPFLIWIIHFPPFKWSLQLFVFIVVNVFSQRKIKFCKICIYLFSYLCMYVCIFCGWLKIWLAEYGMCFSAQLIKWSSGKACLSSGEECFLGVYPGKCASSCYEHYRKITFKKWQHPLNCHFPNLCLDIKRQQWPMKVHEIGTM